MGRAEARRPAAAKQERARKAGVAVARLPVVEGEPAAAERAAATTAAAAAEEARTAAEAEPRRTQRLPGRGRRSKDNPSSMAEHLSRIAGIPN